MSRRAMRVCETMEEVMDAVWNRVDFHCGDKLEEITIADGNVDDTLVEILLRAIITTPYCSLRKLVLQNHKIASKGASCLMRLGSKNMESLTALDLSFGRLDSALGEEVMRGLLPNQHVKVVRMTHNQLGKDFVPILAECLRTNRTIQHMDFSDNQIILGTQSDFFKELENNQIIVGLSLDRNGNPKDVLERVEGVLERNRGIEKKALQQQEAERLRYQRYHAIPFEPHYISLLEDYLSWQDFSELSSSVNSWGESCEAITEKEFSSVEERDAARAAWIEARPEIDVGVIEGEMERLRRVSYPTFPPDLPYLVPIDLAIQVPKQIVLLRGIMPSKGKIYEGKVENMEEKLDDIVGMVKQRVRGGERLDDERINEWVDELKETYAECLLVLDEKPMIEGLAYMLKGIDQARSQRYIMLEGVVQAVRRCDRVRAAWRQGLGCGGSVAIYQRLLGALHDIEDALGDLDNAYQKVLRREGDGREIEAEMARLRGERRAAKVAVERALKQLYVRYVSGHPELANAVPALRDSPMVLYGRTLDDYHIKGEGIQGNILHVERDGVEVVLKRFSMACAADQKRFVRESQRLHDLRDSRVVHIEHVFFADGCAYLQMPLYSGGDLGSFVRGSHPDKEHIVVRAVYRVLGALAHMHTRNIAHGDIKPGNILLDGAHVAYLGDFELSRDASQPASSTTLIGGTERYMAPEQWPPHRQPASLAADVYAFGIMLFALFCGGEDQLVPYHPVDFRAVGDPLLSDLLGHMLAPDPTVRISARDARAHLFFVRKRYHFQVSVFDTVARAQQLARSALHYQGAEGIAGEEISERIAVDEHGTTCILRFYPPTERMAATRHSFARLTLSKSSVLLPLRALFPHPPHGILLDLTPFTSRFLPFTKIIGAASEEDKKAILHHLCLLLGRVHAEGIVLHNLHPENLMVDRYTLQPYLMEADTCTMREAPFDRVDSGATYRECIPPEAGEMLEHDPAADMFALGYIFQYVDCKGCNKLVGGLRAVDPRMRPSIEEIVIDKLWRKPLRNENYLVEVRNRANVMYNTIKCVRKKRRRIKVPRILFPTRVSRSNLLDSLLKHASHMRHVKKPILVIKPYIIYDDESGIDEGGVRRDFYAKSFRALEESDFFIDYMDRAGSRRVLHPGAPTEPLENIGFLLGKLLYDGEHIPRIFPLNVLKYMLGRKGKEDLTEEDLEEVYGGYDLLTMFRNGEHIEHLQEAGFHFDGYNNKREVTEDTLEEYYLAALRGIWAKRHQQLAALSRGFRAAIKRLKIEQFVLMADPIVLDHVLHGPHKIEATSILSRIHWQGADLPETKRFIEELITSLHPSKLRQLMVFWTGAEWCDVPLYIQLTNRADGSLPIARTCSYLLIIDVAPTAHFLKEKLFRAITEEHIID